MASAARAEIGSLFMNSKINLGHPQQPAPLTTNNNTIHSTIRAATMKRKHSKAIDMRFYWLKEPGLLQPYQHIILLAPNTTVSNQYTCTNKKNKSLKTMCKGVFKY